MTVQPCSAASPTPYPVRVTLLVGPVVPLGTVVLDGDPVPRVGEVQPEDAGRRAPRPSAAARGAGSPSSWIASRIRDSRGGLGQRPSTSGTELAQLDDAAAPAGSAAATPQLRAGDAVQRGEHVQRCQGRPAAAGTQPRSSAVRSGVVTRRPVHPHHVARREVPLPADALGPFDARAGPRSTTHSTGGRTSSSR